MTSIINIGATIGSYEILAELNAGGMGQVLLARRRGAHGFEKLFAIKTIRSELQDAPEVRAMFLDEARLLARLTHPAIAQVYDFGEQEGSLYLVMEFVEGAALSQVQRVVQERLPVGVSCRAIGELCHGLHAAHELTDRSGQPLGVVHRDVSPQNVMITYQGRVKIIDFGIALVRDRLTPQTLTGSVKGKPAYMAPEQLRDEPIDQRADIFAAGVMLHELLTGKRLFRASTVAGTINAVLTRPMSPPSHDNACVSPRLDEAVLRSLEREPSNRFQTALEMATELDAAASERPKETLETCIKTLLGKLHSQDHAKLQSVLNGVGSTLLSPRERGRSNQIPTVRLPSSGAAAESASETVDLARARSRPADGERLVRSEGELPGLTDATPDLSTGASRVVGRPRSRRLVIAATILVIMIGIAAGLSITKGGFGPIATSSGDGNVETPSRSSRAAPGLAKAEPLSPADEPKSVDEPSGSVESLAGSSRRKHSRARPQRPTMKNKKGKTESAVQTGPTTYGYFTFAAEPYTHVRINGETVGNTPLRGLRFEIGDHKVELISPETGEVLVQRKMLLREGEHRRVTYP